MGVSREPCVPPFGCTVSDAPVRACARAAARSTFSSSGRHGMSGMPLQPTSPMLPARTPEVPMPTSSSRTIAIGERADVELARPRRG